MSSLTGRKSIFFKAVLFIGFLVLTTRLLELQIVKGNYYRDLSDGNRIRRVAIIAPRGNIYARGGELIAGNLESPKNIVFDTQEGYVKKEISDDEKTPASIVEYRRTYPMSDVVSHVVGYLGKVNSSELGKVDGTCAEKGVRISENWVGRSGLENHYDCILRGIDGEELIEVESNGERVRTLGIRDSVPGDDLKTTLHLPLQKKVASIMQGKKGVVVASDAQGEILAMYSYPSFDSRIFIRGDPDLVEDVLEDKGMPLLNRSIAGTYVPGSIYKPLISIAALEEETIDEDWLYEDMGKIDFKTPYGDYTYKNWYFTQYGGTEGEIDLTKAIARSTDTFFYKVGEDLGIKRVVEWSRIFGLGAKTGIDIPGEVDGLVPDPAWKEEVKGERWFLGNTYHMAIGQGDLLVTPIQMNTATTAIANDGKLCKTHFTGEKDCHDLEISKRNIDLVKEGMEGVCSEGGTGYTFFDFEEKYEMLVACKTGTAQVGIDDDTHAWFTAFAPIEEPEIVITVLVEKAGEGSKVAGPIAREIFDFWFEDFLKEEYKITPTPSNIIAE